MRLWQIADEEQHFTIDLGNVTILKGHSISNYKIIRLIDDYFNNKSSMISIAEDSLTLNKKDWDCLFIPFDANIQLNKLTSKSPLNMVMDIIIENLIASPSYLNVIEAWKELKEEEFFLNQVVSKYDLSVKVLHLDEIQIKNFIHLQNKTSNQSPFDFKLLMLKLFLDKPLAKRRLVLIELPELFANREQLEGLNIMLDTLNHKGITIIISTTSSTFSGRFNYSFEGSMVNEAMLYYKKNKIVSMLPFPIEDNEFKEAVHETLALVDKLANSIISPTDLYIQNQKMGVVIQVMLFTMKVPLNIDYKHFPENIISFLKGLEEPNRTMI